ncbi:hypothetical protein SAMN05216358_0119 [Rhizobium sp. AN5]|uniref:hypothetical protein n=1 Tax=Rhizobium sp. AN5 TaxID=1855304 RepID=UPI000BD3C289|nr:hypothetical protein [Rhizobium sp. AN5]SOC90095.1 hypothetical protein SAMN05216358_0119 [Rhizobium sp. AN5]
MSDDNKKERSCYDVIFHREGIPSYIQVKTYGKGTKKISPANEWNLQTQEHFLAITRAIRETHVNQVNMLVSFEDNQAKSKAVYIETELLQAEKILDSWKIEPEVPLAAPVIERPPGHRVIVILQTVLPKSVFERVYGQMVADSREEYYEALQQGDCEEAKKIKWQLNYHLIMSVVEYFASLPAHLLTKPLKMFDKGE